MGISGVNDEPNRKDDLLSRVEVRASGGGFAETLHGRGDKVIISGRRRSALEEVGRALNSTSKIQEPE